MLQHVGFATGVTAPATGVTAALPQVPPSAGWSFSPHMMPAAGAAPPPWALWHTAGPTPAHVPAAARALRSSYTMATAIAPPTTVGLPGAMAYGMPYAIPAPFHPSLCVKPRASMIGPGGGAAQQVAQLPLAATDGRVTPALRNLSPGLPPMPPIVAPSLVVTASKKAPARALSEDISPNSVLAAAAGLLENLTNGENESKRVGGVSPSGGGAGTAIVLERRGGSLGDLAAAASIDESTHSALLALGNATGGGAARDAAPMAATPTDCRAGTEAGGQEVESPIKPLVKAPLEPLPPPLARGAVPSPALPTRVLPPLGRPSAALRSLKPSRHIMPPMAGARYAAATDAEAAAAATDAEAAAAARDLQVLQRSPVPLSAEGFLEIFSSLHFLPPPAAQQVETQPGLRVLAAASKTTANATAAAMAAAIDPQGFVAEQAAVAAAAANVAANTTGAKVTNAPAKNAAADAVAEAPSLSKQLGLAPQVLALSTLLQVAEADAKLLSDKAGKHRGVRRKPGPGGMWRAEISVGGRMTHLGLHHSEAEAAVAYDMAACKRDGLRAKTNLPVERYDLPGLEAISWQDLVLWICNQQDTSPTPASNGFRGIFKDQRRWRAQIRAQVGDGADGAAGVKKGGTRNSGQKKGAKGTHRDGGAASGTKRVHLGCYDEKAVAARAYDLAVVKRDGLLRAAVNFDKGDYAQLADRLTKTPWKGMPALAKLWAPMLDRGVHPLGPPPPPILAAIGSSGEAIKGAAAPGAKGGADRGKKARAAAARPPKPPQASGLPTLKQASPMMTPSGSAQLIMPTVVQASPLLLPNILKPAHPRPPVPRRRPAPAPPAWLQNKK